MLKAWIAIIGLLTVTLMPAHAAQKKDWLDLARKGWSYELRTTMVGRDMSIPVHINGRDLSGSAICLIGEEPNAESREVLEAFRSLARDVFGKPLPMRYAGAEAKLCGAGRTVYLRLYSGRPPNRDLSNDLSWMNEAYDFGLPADRWYVASSPAMAQTFFGRRGQGTHIMVQQSGREPADHVEAVFYKSILIEELFQSFTFGMDVLHFNRKAAFQSKLQEIPLNIHRLPWGSRHFMEALLKSNPAGLCAFDIFMMHAVAKAPVDETNTPDFIAYIDAEYDRLQEAAGRTLANPRYASILDPSCAAAG